MKKLLFRTLMMVFAALACSSLLLSIILYLGTGRLLTAWEVRENSKLHSAIETALLDLSQTLAVEGRAPDPQTVQEALLELPTTPDWLVVLSSEDVLLYFFRQSESLSGQSRNFLRRLQDITEWYEIRDTTGRLVFKYSAVVPSFSQKESNRLLLGAFWIILVAGSIVSILLSTLFAFLLARPLARGAERLASSLELMATGRRDLVLPGERVSELDRIAQASVLLQDSLKKEEDMRRQWAADISHDLRTPLTVLKGQLEAMADGLFQPSSARLNKSLKEVLRLESLVSSLSLLTKLESPGYQLELASINSLRLIESLAERFSDMACSCGCSLRCLGQNCVFQADQLLLERALGNICENALRYGRPGGAVFLSSSCEAEAVIFHIENEGLIPEDSVAHIFNRLYRGDSARGTSGSGLGLAITKAIVEAHGGSVTISIDKETIKTFFEVRIPAK